MSPGFELLVHEAGPVAAGVPFPPGELRDPARLAVAGPEGKTSPCAARSLVAWPDGSVRWALLSFIATRAGPHLVSFLGTAQAASASVRLEREAASAWVLDNGLVRVSLNGAGPGPVGPLFFEGRPLLTDPGQLRFSVDDASTLHEPERRMTVLEENPLRVRVRLEGAHFTAAGKRRLHYRLDVELWAGQPALRLDYQFFHQEPGAPSLSIRRLALDCDFDFTDAATRRQAVQLEHGLFQQHRDIFNPAPVAIIRDAQSSSPRVEDMAMFLDEGPWPAFLDPPPDRAPAWLALTDGDRTVAMTMQDFQVMSPKRLSSAGRRLSLEFWPERERPMLLPQGRSRRQVVSLAFGRHPLDRQAIPRLLAAPWWEGRGCAAPARFAACGAFDQDKLLPAGAHARLERYLARLVQVDTPSDYFDLGDTPDSGYNRTYPAVSPTKVPLKAGAPTRDRAFLSDSPQLAPWHPADDFEPVWVNNEYDGIHAVASEVMRTGRPGLWPVLRRMVRHNIEVDFWHYHDEPWLHRISPVHSARHATSGGYPSHFWTEGLMEYYGLTGDPDVLEVAVALGDAIIRFFHDPERGPLFRNYDREIGWSFLALVSLYDLVREPRFAEEIDRLALFFMDEQGPGSFRLAPVHVERLYFMLNLFEGFDRYQRLTGRQDLHDWLVKALAPLPGLIEQNVRQSRTAYSTPAALAILYERTGDPGVLRPGLLVLECLMDDDPIWQAPIREIKPMAIAYRSWIRWFGHAKRAGLLEAVEYRGLRREVE